MEIYNLFPGSFGSNCYLLISGNQAAVVDPSADADVILQKVAEHGAALQYILLTHGHFDHTGGVKYVVEEYGAKFACSKKDDFLMSK
jgi:glyoxylase-like metal-dependent hydrolase (beta-lactamase superfamily II)